VASSTTRDETTPLSREPLVRRSWGSRMATQRRLRPRLPQWKLRKVQPAPLAGGSKNFRSGNWDATGGLTAVGALQRGGAVPVRAGRWRLDYHGRWGRRNATAGRGAVAAPAGALATTAPAGGRVAIAGAGGARQRWAALSGAGEQSCAVRDVAAPGMRARQRPLAPLPCRGLRRWRDGGAAMVFAGHERGAPLLPLPVSWPEWPSGRRPAWRCARDQSWAQ